MAQVVAVSIVTYNNESTIVPCLEAVFAQEGLDGIAELRVLVRDNASTDATVSLIRNHFDGKLECIEGSENTGFCGGHNELIGCAIAANAESVLILNPDLCLLPTALRHLLDALRFDTRAGSCCPKLLRADGSMRPIEPPILDAAGMYLTPSIRHFDRGSGERDCGQYDREEYVFGGSGAALLLRTAFIRDAALRIDDAHPLFDPAFFAYREDADLAWRANWLGWRCRYVPRAIGFHQRVVVPERRASLPATLNAYGVRNRFLLQLNNLTLRSAWRCILPGTLRNLLVIAASATVERSSWKAIVQVWNAAPRALRIRRDTLKRRRAEHYEMADFFSAQQGVRPALPSDNTSEAVTSVLAVIVSYNAGARLERCLEHLVPLQKTLPFSLQIAVVDNASTDSSVSPRVLALEADSTIRLIQSETNLGFAAAINRAVSGSSATAVLVLNPDVTCNGEALVQLQSTLSRFSTLGAIAPVLCGEDGNPQFRYLAHGFPTLGSVVAESLFLHRLWPWNPWTARLHRQPHFVTNYILGRRAVGDSGPFEHPELPILVPQPAAACLLIRRTAYELLGGFDEQFYPAWFEDVDFLKRMADLGIAAGVERRARVLHEGGYSKEEMPIAVFRSIWFGNLLRYWKKHGTRAERTIIQGILPFAKAIRRCIDVATRCS